MQFFSTFRRRSRASIHVKEWTPNLPPIANAFCIFLLHELVWSDYIAESFRQLMDIACTEG